VRVNSSSFAQVQTRDIAAGPPSEVDQVWREKRKKERKDMMAAKYNAFDCRLAAENSLPLAPSGP